MHRTRDERRLGALKQPAGISERRGSGTLLMMQDCVWKEGFCVTLGSPITVDGRRLGGLGDYGFVGLIANKIDLKASYRVPVCACHLSVCKVNLPTDVLLLHVSAPRVAVPRDRRRED